MDGLANRTTEFQIPPQVSRYANFLFSFIGRGVCKFIDFLPRSLCSDPNLNTVYLLIGGLLIGDKVLSKISGGIVGIIGVAFIALEFVPSIEPPSNMREADAGWGAEQV